ncbi:peptidase S26 [Sphingomonas glacialis]|uniref:Peptidase S26 n=1 Tax=Sphingomonas glacialis TaxID=658225 RepID=A0ABQ3LRJ1_9SPHN|nr:S26 family signal peptidase [Sphingomonas glacialis]GHH24208.1 peptidase S26 [Sphingomonas glacialis]
MTRFGYVMVASFATMATVVPAFLHPAARLIWNASESVPIGLYAVRAAAQPRRGDLVAVVPPTALAGYLAGRHYLPLHVPLLKHVAGISGQRVCRPGTRVTVDGVTLGSALHRDHRGRPLPVWHGCRTLGTRDVFLMNASVPDSFDGRYFGPLPASTIVGRLTPVWIVGAHPRATERSATGANSPLTHTKEGSDQ